MLYRVQVYRDGGGELLVDTYLKSDDVYETPLDCLVADPDRGVNWWGFRIQEKVTPITKEAR